MSRDPYRSSTGDLGRREYDRVDRAVYDRERRRPDDEDVEERRSRFEDDEVAYTTRRRVPGPPREPSPDDFIPPRHPREPSIGRPSGGGGGATFADDRFVRETRYVPSGRNDRDDRDDRKTEFRSEYRKERDDRDGRDDRKTEYRAEYRKERDDRDDRDDSRSEYRSEFRKERDDRDGRDDRKTEYRAEYRKERDDRDDYDDRKTEYRSEYRHEERDDRDSYVSLPGPPRRRPFPPPAPELERETKTERVKVKVRDEEDDRIPSRPFRMPGGPKVVDKADEVYQREIARYEDVRRDPPEIRHEEYIRREASLPARYRRPVREEDDDVEVDVADKLGKVRIDARRRAYSNARDDEIDVDIVKNDDADYHRRSYHAPMPPPSPGHLQPAERVRETEVIRTTRSRSAHGRDHSYERSSGPTRRSKTYEESLVDEESLVSANTARSRSHRGSSITRSVSSESSTSSGGATLKSGPRPGYPKKGKTRIPGRLVSERALIDLGYPFIREGNTVVVQLALGKNNIDDVLKLSKDYKKSEEEMVETKKKRISVTKEVDVPARRERVEREVREVDGPSRRERIEKEVVRDRDDYIEEQHRREEYYMTPPVQQYVPPPVPTYAPAPLPPPPVPVQVQVSTTSAPPPPPAADVSAKVYVRDVAPEPGYVSVRERDVGPDSYVSVRERDVGPESSYVSVREHDVGTTTSTALTTTRARSHSRPVIVDAPGPLELSNDIPVGPAAMVAAESSPHYHHHHYDDDDYDYDYDYVKRVERSTSRPARSRSRHSHRHSRSFSRGDGALYAHLRDRSRSYSPHHHHRSHSRHEVDYYSSGPSEDRAMVRAERLSTGELVVYEDEVERIEEPHRGVRIEKDRKGNMALSVPKYR